MDRSKRRLRLERLQQRQLMAADLSLIDSGLESDYFDTLQQQIAGNVLDHRAPVIGDALASSEVDTSRFVRDVGVQLKDVDFDANQSVTTQDVRAQLKLRLGVDDDAIQVIGNDGEDDIQFVVTIAGQQQNTLVDLDLIGADPEIVLQLGGEDTVDLDVTYQYELNFGVREIDGVSQFYID
ncbi:MAG: hypothetical protein AAFN70_21045, partial [Planctomycetota bacterium]